jgi:hypothetical protein
MHLLVIQPVECHVLAYTKDVSAVMLEYFLEVGDTLHADLLRLHRFRQLFLKLIDLILNECLAFES